MQNMFSILFLVVLFVSASGQARVERLKNPNVMVIMSDEEAMIPHGWEEVMQPFYDEQLPARKMLRANGIDFRRHYASSTACVPSRGVFYTGQYPEVTGLTQTNGIAKFYHDDATMTWLAPNTVPTIGNWLGNAQFSSTIDDYRKPYDLANRVYIGKWHLSDADLYDTWGRARQTVSRNFQDIPDNIARYREAAMLEPFGFSGWIGPEPHGAARENSGLHRDPRYVEQVREFFLKYSTSNKQAENEPFFLAVNLVNPHDIVLAWGLYLRNALNVDPTVPFPPRCEQTDDLNLDEQPPVHAEYKETYCQMLGPKGRLKGFYEKNKDLLRQFYYDLLKQSDKSIGDVMAALKDAGLADNTITIFTSDHGDLLGRRGGQWQKWHTAHEEVQHLPFVVHNPQFDPRAVTMLTSHADMLPTVLGLLDIDEEKTAKKLAETFSHVYKLPGQDLSPIIYDEMSEEHDRAIFTSTRDEISRGENKYNATVVNLLPKWTLPFIPFSTFEPVGGRRYVESCRFYDNDRYHVLMRYYDPDKTEEDVGYDDDGESYEEYVLYDSDIDGFQTTDIFDVVDEDTRKRYIDKMNELRDHYVNPIQVQ